MGDLAEQVEFRHVGRGYPKEALSQLEDVA